MQKKHLNTILIIVVVAIWGGLVYKFARPFFSSNQTIISVPKEAFSQKETHIHSKDTFELAILTHDPFLAKTYYKSTSSKVTSKKTTKKKSKPKKLVWPKISYLGFVKAQINKNKLGLIRINKKLYKVRSKDKVATMDVLKVTNDSIGLKLGNEKKFFKK